MSFFLLNTDWYLRLIFQCKRMKELLLSHAHAHPSHHPAGACSCWQCVWNHVLFNWSVSPCHHSGRLRRCHVDSQAWTSVATELNPHASAHVYTELNPRSHTGTHSAHTHTYTHTVGCSVFIRHAAEGSVVPTNHWQAKFITLTYRWRRRRQNGEMTDIQNKIITPKVILRVLKNSDWQKSRITTLKSIKLPQLLPPH